MKRRGFKASKPDVFACAKPGTAAVEVCQLNHEGVEKVKEFINGMIKAATRDFGDQLGLRGEPDLEWVKGIDEYYDRKRIKELFKKSVPKDFNNPFLIICCEFGALLGDVMSRLNDKLVWVYNWPYWDSFLYDERTGFSYNVFDWSIKKFSEYGVDDGYKEKLIVCDNFVKNGLTK